MATSGLDSAFTALLLAQVNGGSAVTLTTPLRSLFMSAMRTVDTGADTEITTGSGYVQQVGSLFSGQALTFAAASAGAPTTQNSNVAATVTNMPASTWAGCTIIDSKATPRTVGDGATTNTSTTVTSATAAFVAGDVGAIITAGANLPANTTIASVTNGTTVVVSQAATATGTSLSLTVNKLNTPNKTFWATLASSKTVNLGDTVTVPSGSWQTTLG